MLEVIEILGRKYPTPTSKQKRTFVVVQCSYCNNTRSGQKDCLLRYDHCGCRRNIDKKKHGFTGTRQYNTWNQMKNRCNNPNYSEWERYGGRGITYDTKWETFEGFWEDMSEGYTNDMTLDRIDVNKNYSKDNCQWLTKIDNIKKMHSDKNEYIKYLENRVLELERILDGKSISSKT